MQRFLTGLLLCIPMAWAGADGPDCTSDPGPADAVRGYITSMKEHRFEDAYQYVSKTMTDGKPVAEWAALQKKMFELGGVAIGDVDVRAAQREVAADGVCAPQAKVPNVLHAGDVLNN